MFDETPEPKNSTVFIVDDSDAVQDAIRWLVDEVGLLTKSFSVPREFLSFYRPEMRGCLVLDMRLPDMSGLEVQRRMNDANICLPVIFLTGHGDIPATVRAMKAGAFDFLQKPFNDQLLLDTIVAAVKCDIRRHMEIERRAIVERSLSCLTSREKEVLDLLRAGNSNKRIARTLSISVRTVEGHRARVMEKLGVGNICELMELILRVSGYRENARRP